MNESTRLDNIALTRQEHTQAKAAVEAANKLKVTLQADGHLSPNAYEAANAFCALLDEQECDAWKAYVEAVNTKPAEAAASEEVSLTHPALATA
jgi:hypothetical protein